LRIRDADLLCMQALHSAIDEQYLGCPHLFFFYARLSDLLVVANSSLNVFVYYCFNRRFSRAVRGATAGRQRQVLGDSLDSRQETFSGAVARPSGVQAYELVARGGPAIGECARLDEQVSDDDCETMAKRHDVTVVDVTHNHHHQVRIAAASSGRSVVLAPRPR